MLQKERHDHILAKLNLESSIRVRDIALEYNVTEDCIRKDLAILEKEGKLKRIHGGAVSIRENPHTFNVSARLDKYVEEKKCIARKAIELTTPEEMIFLGISTFGKFCFISFFVRHFFVMETGFVALLSPVTS